MSDHQSGWTDSPAQVIQQAREQVLDTQSRIDSGLQEISGEAALRDVVRVLAVRAPACERAFVAGSLWRIGSLVLIASNGEAREAFKVPADDEELLRQIIRLWRANPDVGVAVRAHKLGLVVQADSWQSFDGWLRSFANASERQVGGTAGVPDRDAPRACEIDLPELGSVTYIRREPVTQPRPSAVISDRELMQRLNVNDLDPITSRQVGAVLQPTVDAGGWIVWPGARAKPRRIGSGLRVVDGGELVTLHPPHGADYQVTVSAGGRHAPFEQGELPDWLARELRAR
jgi:hypothetical protein